MLLVYKSFHKASAKDTNGFAQIVFVKKGNQLMITSSAQDEVYERCGECPEQKCIPSHLQKQSR
jgi:hypothetical protein